MPFVPELSTDSICVGANTSLCLSNKLTEMDDAIKAAQMGSTVSPLLIASMHLGRLDNNNGSELASANRICSDPIAIESGKTYWQQNNKGVSMYVLLYNADEAFVQFMGSIGSGLPIQINQADAVFLRFSSLVGEYDLTNEIRFYDVDPTTSVEKESFSKEEADARFAAMTHKNSHATGGTDALTPGDIGAVPTSRKVNGKALSSDISLSAAELGAAALSHTHSFGDIGGGSISEGILPTIPLSKGGTGANNAATALDNLGVAGRSMAGQTVEPVMGTSVQAGPGAEIFNDYAPREYGAGAVKGNVASGEYSHAEGVGTTASEYATHAEGMNTVALGKCSHAAGVGTIANDYQYVVGTYNVEKPGGYYHDKLIVGAGWPERNNALRVQHNGGVVGGYFSSTGADYAELFEWKDSNRSQEDRAGLFVTLAGEKIRIAEPEDKVILGIVSSDPSMMGDVYDDQWSGMYLRDVFGRVLYANREIPALLGPNGEVIEEACTVNAPQLNPNYRADEEYIPRTKRPEWDAVGMLGKLVVLDDGTCDVDGFCTVGHGGVATKADEETPYYVMARLDRTHIRILIR